MESIKVKVITLANKILALVRTDPVFKERLQTKKDVSLFFLYERAFFSQRLYII